MKIAIYGRPTLNNTSIHIQSLFDKLNEYNVEIIIYEPFYEFLKQKLKVADSIKTFKPSPDVYDHFVRTSNAEKENAWLISSNPFDVIGAISAGMKAVWVQRSKEVIFDPWGVEPTITINSLLKLRKKIEEYYSN